MTDNPSQIEEEKVNSEDLGKIIKHHVWGAMGIGLIPVPLVDFLALTGVQLNMLRKLTKLYNVPFSKHKGKNLLAGLVGAGLPTTFSMPVASLVKTVPVLGQTAGPLTMSVLAGATTYAVGKVFIQHFESGGTFLDFDPAAVKEYYQAMFEEGRKFASDHKKRSKTA